MIKIPSKRILEYITNNLSYNPETGIITGKKGKPIGTRRRDGCIILQLIIGKTEDGCQMVYPTYGHQIAWFLSHKEWANLLIDHINSQRWDNRLSNLRLATRLQNSHNIKKTVVKETTSQYKGVRKVGKKWRAYITNEGKTHHLGYYLTEKEAAEAYDKASSELHGEFGKLNLAPTDPAPQP